MSTNEEMVSLKPEQAPDKLEIVRPSELAKNNITGVVAEGILEKKEKNKFDDKKFDYFIRAADGTLYILNDTKSLSEQLGQEGVVGMKVRVEYNGKKPTKNKKGYHDFSCFATKA